MNDPLLDPFSKTVLHHRRISSYTIAIYHPHNHPVFANQDISGDIEKVSFKLAKALLVVRWVGGGYKQSPVSNSVVWQLELITRTKAWSLPDTKASMSS